MATTFGIQQDLGTDISSYPGLDPSFSLIAGNRVLEEMVIRRLTTQRGNVVDDPAFGTDLRGYLNLGDPGFSAAPNQSVLYRIKSDVERELVKDQRVSQAVAVVTYNQTATGFLPANCLHVVVSITAGNNPFTLELAVTKLTVALLKTG